MPNPKERILVVESDPMVADLIARQALTPLGYEVDIVSDVSSALQKAIDLAPDIVIANLELPGLSGKDLMAALSSQKINIPVIMIAPQGKEKDVIQAFRLGASDYVGSPVREAEIVSAVDRAIQQVRARHERERLSQELERTNKQLQKRVKELTTMFAIGKAVTSVTALDKLFQAIIEGALRITEADIGWLLIKEERGDDYILKAHQNLPKSLVSNMNKPWDDGISNLVARSGETFSIHGEAMQRFTVSAMGKSAVVVPVKVQSQTIALLVVIRKANVEFRSGDQAMLAAVSDYASISLVNSRLFQALDERAEYLQAAVAQAREKESVSDETIEYISQELQTPLAAADKNMSSFLSNEPQNIKQKQLEVLQDVRKNIQQAREVVASMALMARVSAHQEPTRIDLNDAAVHAAGRFRESAEMVGVEIKVEHPSEPQFVHADRAQIDIVFDALIANALRYSPAGGQVNVKVEQGNGQLQVSVKDQGIGISKRNIEKVFDRFYQVNGNGGGLGIGLTLVKEIVTAYGGKTWVESKLEAGSTFHFTLNTRV